MNLFRSKKSMILILMLSIFIVFIFMPSLYIKLNSSRDPFSSKIGEIQYSILNSVYNTEAELYYVDKSARYAAFFALRKLEEKGGYTDDYPCGTFNSYVLWKSESYECFPTENKIILSFQDTVNPIFNNYLKEKDLTSDNYDFFIKKEDQQFRFIGTALKNIRSDIKANGKKVGKYSIKPSFDMLIDYDLDFFSSLMSEIEEMIAFVTYCEENEPDFMGCVNKFITDKMNDKKFGTLGTFTSGGADHAWEALGDNKYRLIWLPKKEMENNGEPGSVVSSNSGKSKREAGRTDIIVKIQEGKLVVVEGIELYEKEKDNIKLNEKEPEFILDTLYAPSSGRGHQVLSLKEFNEDFKLGLKPLLGYVEDNYIWEVDCDKKTNSDVMNQNRIVPLCITDKFKKAKHFESNMLIQRNPTVKFAIHVSDSDLKNVDDMEINSLEGTQNLLLKWEKTISEEYIILYTKDFDINGKEYLEGDLSEGEKKASKIILSTAEVETIENIEECKYQIVGRECNTEIKVGQLYEQDNYYYYIIENLEVNTEYQFSILTEVGDQKINNVFIGLSKDNLAPGIVNFQWRYLSNFIHLGVSEIKENIDGSEFSYDLKTFYVFIQKDTPEGLIDIKNLKEEARTLEPIQIQANSGDVFYVSIIAIDNNENPIKKISTKEGTFLEVNEEYKGIIDELSNPQKMVIP